MSLVGEEIGYLVQESSVFLGVTYPGTHTFLLSFPLNPPPPQEEVGRDLGFWGSRECSPWGHLGVISLQISGSSSHTCSPHDTP